MVRVYNHPAPLRNLSILKEGDPMSKFLQSEHGDSSSQSTIVAVTPGHKSAAFNAQGWEAFVGPCQTWHGRSTLHEPQARTEFTLVLNSVSFRKGPFTQDRGRKTVVEARGIAGCVSVENFSETTTSDNAGNGGAS